MVKKAAQARKSGGSAYTDDELRALAAAKPSCDEATGQWSGSPGQRALQKFRDFVDMRLATDNPYPHLPEIHYLKDEAMKKRYVELLPDARLGRRFRMGREPGTEGMLRRLIRRELLEALSKGMTLKEVSAAWMWCHLQGLTPKKRMYIEFLDTHLWEPVQGNVGRRRFQNILSEEKQLQKK